MSILGKDRTRIIDTVEAYELNKDGSFGRLILRTNNNPNIIQRFLMKIGKYKCAGDAMMNFEIQRQATSIYNYYGFISFGIDSATPTDYTLTDLKSPVMTRAIATKGYATTYITNDTAVFTGVLTATGSYTIIETGLHDALTGGNMGARQTSCSIPTTNGVAFAMVWRVCVARG